MVRQVKVRIRARDALPMPAIDAEGLASPNAHGHEAAKIAIAR